MRLKISHTAAPRMTPPFEIFRLRWSKRSLFCSNENETIAAAKRDLRDKDDGERLESNKSPNELILTWTISSAWHQSLTLDLNCLDLSPQKRSCSSGHQRLTARLLLLLTSSLSPCLPGLWGLEVSILFPLVLHCFGTPQLATLLRTISSKFNQL